MKNSIKVAANAKINLHLEITGKRPNGYHDISSCFQSVSLKDTLEISLNNSGIITAFTRGAEITGDNLVVSAAEKLLKKADLNLGAEIYLEKNIPLFSGLGGGSADAAATLIGINTLLNNKLSNKELEEIALSLGADVPFCLYGGTKKAEGLGEILTDVTLLKDYFIVLVKQFQKESTGKMYQRADKLESNGSVTDKFICALQSNDIKAVKEYGKNDFLSVSDDITGQKLICNDLESVGAFYCGLSGSGPTIFGLFEKKPEEKVFSELKNRYKEVYLCKTVNSGVEIISR